MKAVVRTGRGERGATAIQVLVILVPVFFGFMGFAIDLGRLYLARGEVKSAANAMALAAAQKLIGTDASIGNATVAMRFPVENSGGFANKYDFGGVVIGEGNSRLSSPMPEPQFFESVGAATESGENAGGGDEAGSSTAKHVRIDIQAEAPLTFWSFLPGAESRKINIAARAVAGLSAPVCLGCGIDAIAVAPLNADDSTNFGFEANTRYTFGYQCTGAQQPAPLANTVQRVPYVLLNRYNDQASLFPSEDSQAFRIGAGGLPSDPDRTRACVQISAIETVWTSATPSNCIATRPLVVGNYTCGLASRFDSALATGCDTVAESTSIITAYTPDSDITDLDDYAAYTGNLRRILTVAIVDTVSVPTSMTVLGFRQFLLQPDSTTSSVNTQDVNGRFIATYIGYPVPLKQGYLGGCSVTQGPGKVVLHQ